jgi:hypothetical protein|tara:strand:- start:415 stop:1311 length:897 start_codon:yes stop_codon:yes gene_type:complete
MAEERIDAPANIGSGDSSSSDDGLSSKDRAAFDAAEAVALAHVDEHRSPYGGPMSRRELLFEVLETHRYGDDIRVRIGYRPSRGFSGRSGQEWILIDPDGAVRTRELISRPKDSQPWVLIALAGISVIAALVLVPMIIARSNPTGDPLYRAGRTLWMRVSPPDVVSELQYGGRTTSGDAVNFRIAGPGNGWNLAVVHVSLHNETSQQVSINIDEAAAVLIGVDGTEFSPINVVTRSEGMSGPIDSQYRYPDFVGLWRSIIMRGSEEVAGMLIFEVPPDFEADRFNWKASDTIHVGFRD